MAVTELLGPIFLFNYTWWHLCAINMAVDQRLVKPLWRRYVNEHDLQFYVYNYLTETGLVSNMRISYSKYF